MAIDALVKPFLALPLFRGLKPIQLTEIVRRADRVIFKPGDTLVAEDDVADGAIVIVSGECVRVNTHEPGSVGETIPAGAMISELAMLVESVATSTIMARTSVRALRLTRSEMHVLMREDPALADHMAELIRRRLQSLAEELKSIDHALAEIGGFNPAEQLAAPRVSRAAGAALH